MYHNIIEMQVKSTLDSSSTVQYGGIVKTILFEKLFSQSCKYDVNNVNINKSSSQCKYDLSLIHLKE